MRVRRLAAAIAATAVLALVASPAHAAPPALPDGDALYVLPCFGSDPQYLYGLDAESIEATPIGDGFELPQQCALDSAFDPTTGSVHSLTVLPGPIPALISVDLASGEVSEPVPITGDGPVMVTSFTIGLDGTAWVMTETTGELFTLDLETAEATPAGIIESLDHTNVMSLSTDPATGALVALQADGDLQLIDPDALSATTVGGIGAVALPGDMRAFYGFTIDSAGTAWIIGGYLNGPVGGPYALVVAAPLADPESGEFVGNFLDTSTDEYFASISIFSTWAEPAPGPGPGPQQPSRLAATGADPAPLGFVAGMFALAGLGVLVASRRRAA